MIPVHSAHRKAFGSHRSRRPAEKALAIIASLREHAGDPQPRTLADYGVTPESPTGQHVLAILATRRPEVGHE
jgi:hypothetical protein